MYIRKRLNSTGTTTVYLIEGIRVKDRTINKSIKCFGSSSDANIIEGWVREAELLKNQLSKEQVKYSKFTNIKQSSDISSCVTNEFGIGYLYNNLFNIIFGNNLKIGSEADNKALIDLIAIRIASPVSKLRISKIATDFGVNLNANRIYRLMDKINDKLILQLKKLVLQNTKNLLGLDKIQIMFYDLTTIYFENNSVSDLKEFGYSKDGKSQHVQISLALIVTNEGLPVDYQIFKGNTFEGSTLIPTLNQLRNSYQVTDASNVTIVADSAMLSNSNVDALIANGYKFIVAARIKNMTAKVTKEILQNDNYKLISAKNYKDGRRDHTSCKVIDLNKKINNNDTDTKEHDSNNNKSRLISVYSTKRKRKDEYERNRLLEKVKKLEGKSSKSALRGALKKPFVKLDGNSLITIDYDKIKEASKFDGYYGFITNSDLDPKLVIANYKGLWQVEQGFRINKHNLKIRPVYHYTDRRIKAHFAICYLSFTLIRSLEYKMRRSGNYIPIEQLHRQLNQIKKINITVNNLGSSIITNIPEQIRLLFVALNMQIPKRYQPNIQCLL